MCAVGGRLEREMRRERMVAYVRRMGGRRHGRLVYILLKVGEDSVY